MVGRALDEGRQRPGRPGSWRCPDPEGASRSQSGDALRRIEELLSSPLSTSCLTRSVTCISEAGLFTCHQHHAPQRVIGWIEQIAVGAQATISLGSRAPCQDIRSVPPPTPGSSQSHPARRGIRFGLELRHRRWQRQHAQRQRTFRNGRRYRRRHCRRGSSRHPV